MILWLDVGELESEGTLRYTFLQLFYHFLDGYWSYYVNRGSGKNETRPTVGDASLSGMLNPF